jgi:hypothetical protein
LAASEARLQGEQVLDHLRLACVDQRIPIMTGEYQPGAADVAAEADTVVEDAGAARDRLDRLGLDVFQEAPDVEFLSFGLEFGRVSVAWPAERLVYTLEQLALKDVELSERYRAACELLFAAQHEAGGRAKLLLLSSALECLIIPERRSDIACRLVDEFIRASRAAGLPDHELASIEGSLRFLKKESISAAGARTLAQLLHDGTFDGVDAAQFFRKIYDARSRLVHTGHPGLPADEFVKLVDRAESFVRSAILAAYEVPRGPGPAPLHMKIGLDQA